METKIEETLNKVEFVDPSMTCIIQDNSIYIKSRRYTSTRDFVWHMHKINPEGGNKYFNIAAAYTSDAAAEPGDIGGLSS
jgi:hypothetical protein